MRNVKLDAQTIASLQLGDKADEVFWDATITKFGFRLRLGSNGRLRSSWIVQYRSHGISRRLLLGDGGVLTAEQARSAAKKALARVELGEDPQSDKTNRRAKGALRFDAVTADYIAVKADQVRPRTMEGIRRYLRGPYSSRYTGSRSTPWTVRQWPPD